MLPSESCLRSRRSMLEEILASQAQILLRTHGAPPQFFRTCLPEGLKRYFLSGLAVSFLSPPTHDPTFDIPSLLLSVKAFKETVRESSLRNYLTLHCSTAEFSIPSGLFILTHENPPPR